MAGKPKKRQLLADIKKFGAEELCDRIASGETIAGISAEFGVSRNFMSQTMNKDPDIKKLLDAARRAHGDALIDEARHLADSCEPDPNSISKMREQVSLRKWIASATNPDNWAAKQQPLVNISLGDMHLSALKKAQASPMLDITANSANTADQDDEQRRA